MVRQLEMDDAAWRQYFAAHAIRPYVVFYEDFVECYEETALNVMRYLHIPLPEHIYFKPRRLQKQADSLSEEWVQRYHDLKKRKGFHQIAASFNTLFLPHVRMIPSLNILPDGLGSSSNSGAL
jgi:LPS sulfotransferase NodH